MPVLPFAVVRKSSAARAALDLIDAEDLATGLRPITHQQ